MAQAAVTSMKNGAISTDGGGKLSSASIIALNAGSDSFAFCSSHDSPAIFCQLGLRINGCTVPRQFMMTPIPRRPIAATRLAPLSLALHIPAICSVHGICLMGDCNMVKAMGTPVSRLNRPIQPNSSHSSKKSVVSSNTPCPTLPMARPIPTSSGSVAVVPGTSSPSIDLCNTVREVEKPKAPARKPSSTSRAISAMSASVGSSLSAPRCPMTKARNAPCGTCVPISMVRGRRSSASRYSGKVSQSHFIPSANAVPGISSTPSIRPMSQSCLSFFAGAKPTPQLPMTTVVTPCQLDGPISLSQVAWPS